ncbi:hypothetical protein GQ457_08G024570 [Hibiscus cannabinus]
MSRTRCEARIKFKFDEEYQYWKVEKFHAEHNHEMVKPTQVPYMRSFRKINELDEIKIKSMHNSGIAPNRMMRNFVNEAGSSKNVGFISKDLYNFLDRIKREEVKDGDAETMMAYLYGKKESDPFFFVRHTRDEYGNLEKLFWCDGISRTDYKEFGHVLAFDTTYKCNAYNKPFVVLVGVNHHRNTVLFGCALVVHEKEDTYIWVLQQLIAAGDGYKPLTVITDRDKAMANAISQVLPEAKHRLCLWHIMRNLKSNDNKRITILRWKESHQDYKTMDEQPYCDGVLATLKSNAAKLESVGFPCRHMFAVLKYEKAKEIPRGCIMKRWTIYAKEDGLEKKDECVESDNPTTVQARYSNLASYCVNICHRASQTLKTFNEVKDQFAKMSLKLQAEKVGSKKRTSKNKEFLGIGDPIVVEIGRGKPKKIKRQASSFNPTHVPYVEDDEDVTLDLHKTFEFASNKHCDRDMKHTNALQISNLAGCMPNTYQKDDISKASYSNELKKNENKPNCFRLATK